MPCLLHPNTRLLGTSLRSSMHCEKRFTRVYRLGLQLPKVGASIVIWLLRMLYHLIKSGYQSKHLGYEQRDKSIHSNTNSRLPCITFLTVCMYWKEKKYIVWYYFLYCKKKRTSLTLKPKMSFFEKKIGQLFLHMYCTYHLENLTNNDLKIFWDLKKGIKHDELESL